MWNGRGVLAGAEANVVQESEAEAADDDVSGVEGQAVSDDGPDDADNSHEDEALHHRRQNVLATNQPAVKEGEGWACHQQDECGAGEHPGGVAGIDIFNVLNLDGRHASDRRRVRRLNDGGCHHDGQ